MFEDDLALAKLDVELTEQYVAQLKARKLVDEDELRLAEVDLRAAQQHLNEVAPPEES